MYVLNVLDFLSQCACSWQKWQMRRKYRSSTDPKYMLPGRAAPGEESARHPGKGIPTGRQDLQGRSPQVLYPGGASQLLPESRRAPTVNKPSKLPCAHQCCRECISNMKGDEAGEPPYTSCRHLAGRCPASKLSPLPKAQGFSTRRTSSLSHSFSSDCMKGPANTRGRY